MNKEDIKLMVHKDGPCVSYLILACSIVICSGFAYWLYMESDIEKFRNYSFKYSELVYQGQTEEAKKLLSEMYISIFDDEIDMRWLPLITKKEDGYEKLQFYLRLLAGNPDHELIYKEISGLLDKATEEFTIKQRTKYLSSINEIKGLHNVLLERYGLLITSD